MKFIVSRDVLYRNLSAISGVMSSNSSMAILGNFLLTIKDDKLTLTASDLDSTMTAEIELENVEGEGAVAVPAKTLLETLKLIPETPLVFAIDEEKNIFKFTAANGEYDAPCFDGNEYPQIKEMTNPSSFDIEASILQRAISKTLFATGTDELRPTMMGVLCELSGEGITFVSTDAHKLVRYRNTKVKADDFTSFILPKKPIAHLKNILAGLDENVHVEYSKEQNHIRFSFDNLVLYSSLKEGKYPDYEKVIPKENPNNLVISREDFLKSIRRVGIYSNQSTFQIRVSLSQEATNITAEDMDYSNKAVEVITGEYAGEKMDIGFNSRFLREMLENMDGDQIRVEMSKPNRAALILPMEQYDEHEDVLMLIMPVMLNY
ncbi:MAG: DNA polymerase III subunit beta [Bacteroidales bacterium]|nr:DNA polymerase III subunit beta [Bacteroidales bacterium]